MSDDVMSLLEEPVKKAIFIIQNFIDIYSNSENLGLFSGAERYINLENRVKVVAYQSKNLSEFYSKLIDKMLVSTQRVSKDIIVIDILKMSEQDKILKALAIETSTVITVARYLRTLNKIEIHNHVEPEPFNDNLDL